MLLTNCQQKVTRLWLTQTLPVQNILQVQMIELPLLASAWFFNEDVRIALTLVFFVWILNWAKDNLGSPKIAVVLAAVIVYLTFYKHKELVWVVVALILFSTFGKGFLSKVMGGGKSPAPDIVIKRED